MGYLEFTDFFPGKWRCGSDYPILHVIRVYHWGTGWEAFVWMSNVNLDFDGQPDAYGPPAMGPKDTLNHAGKGDPRGWYGVASYSIAERDEINAELAKKKSTERIKLDESAGLGQSTRLSGRFLHDAKGKRYVLEPQIRYPVIQQKINGDPREGFYVSATSHVADRNLPEWKQNRYVDGSKVSYGALSGKLRDEGKVVLGDYALAIRLGGPTGLSQTSGFPFMDSGGDNSWAVGECSYKVFTDLGGTGVNNNFQNAFIVFPYSKRYDGDIKIGIQSQLRMLSNADNADDLPMLMAFTGQAGNFKDTGVSGYQLWKEYQAKTDREKAQTPRPRHYDTIVRGLRAWGYVGLQPLVSWEDHVERLKKGPPATPVRKR